MYTFKANLSCRFRLNFTENICPSNSTTYSDNVNNLSAICAFRINCFSLSFFIFQELSVVVWPFQSQCLAKYELLKCDLFSTLVNKPYFHDQSKKIPQTVSTGQRRSIPQWLHSGRRAHHSRRGRRDCGYRPEAACALNLAARCGRQCQSLGNSQQRWHCAGCR